VGNDPPATGEEFFQERERLISRGKNAERELDAWEDRLRSIAHTAPEAAAQILATLATSLNSDDRETAAIYVAYLFDTRREEATDLLQKLFQDPNVNVRRQALSTIDEITSDKHITAAEAAHLNTTDS
jgi:HEAT repeat protein